MMVLLITGLFLTECNAERNYDAIPAAGGACDTAAPGTPDAGNQQIEPLNAGTQAPQQK